MQTQPTNQFDALLSDPMIRLVMQSDGVREKDMREMLCAVRKRLAVRNGDTRRAA